MQVAAANAAGQCLNQYFSVLKFGERRLIQDKAPVAHDRCQHSFPHAFLPMAAQAALIYETV